MTQRKTATIILFLFAASATAAPSPPTLPQPVARVDLAGFSVQPPDVSGWLVLGRQPTILALARRVSGDNSIALQAGIYRSKTVASPDDLVSEWKSEESQANNGERYQILAHDVTKLEWQGAVCARSHASVKDLAPHTPSGKSGPMTVYSESLACEHPNNRNILVYITYSLRTNEAEPPATFHAEAEAALQSIAFTPWVNPTAQNEVLESKVVSSPAGVVITQVGGSGDDFARRILCAQDGSCTLFGFSGGTFAKTTEAWLSHLDPTGKIQWAEAYGGDNYDTLWNAIALEGGGYLEIGASASRYQADGPFVNPQDYTRPLIVRLDASGQPLWAYSVELSSGISGAELAQAYALHDGNILVVGTYTEAFPDSGVQPMPGVWSAPAPGHDKGSQYSYPLLIDLGPDGTPRWVRRYAFGDLGGAGLTVTEAASGHLILSGSIYTGKDNELFAMETNSDGTPLHTVGLSASAHLGANVSLSRADGSYMVLGHAVEERGSHKTFVAFFDPDLKFNAGSLYDFADGVRPLGFTQRADGTICIAGRTESLESKQASGVAWLINGEGTDQAELWLTGPGLTEFESVAALQDGGLRLLGDSNAFGGSGFDAVITTWEPTKSPGTANKLETSAFKPQVTDIKTVSTTAGVGVVQPVPVASIDVTRFVATAPSTH